MGPRTHTHLPCTWIWIPLWYWNSYPGRLNRRDRLTNINNACQYGLMARNTGQINPLCFFDRTIDWLMETTVWIQKQFHFSEVFGLVSQGILIKTYNCVRRNKQLSHFQVWLSFPGGDLQRLVIDWKLLSTFGSGLNENMAGKACGRYIDATKLCGFFSK